MDPLRLPDAIREAWAVTEALRRLGFPADDIFFSANGPIEPGWRPYAKDQPHRLVEITAEMRWQIVCTLQAQGKEFVVTVGFLGEEFSYEGICETWNTFIEGINNHTIDDATLQRLWDASDVRQKGLRLLGALHDRGIAIPKELS